MITTPEREAQYEDDFALGGEVEFEELEGEAGDELESLVAGVRGARLTGA